MKARSPRPSRITSRKRSTNDSERSLLGLFVEDVRDYAFFTLDVDGHITSWNIGAERLKGYSADEILGKPLSIFYTPEDIARGLPAEMIRRAVADGQAKDEGLRVRKDGSQFWARVLLNAIRDDDGVIRGFIKITQDISEQKRIEHDLRENEERFRSFSQNFPGFNWIADSEGRYRFANRNFERELSSSSKDWLGKSPKELFSGEVARTIERSNQTVLSTKAPVLLTEKVEDAGVARYFLVSKFPIQRDDETLIGGVSIDITPRIEATEALKRVREELIKQERLGSIAQLSSVLAHDLNNTLNAISLRLWALNSDPEFAKRNHTEKLLGLVDRAAGSVARLQTFVRAHREPQLERLDLARLIRKAIESVRSDLGAADLRIDVSQVPADLPPVLGLASDLHQVFTNLLSNAHDAMPNGGTIEISAGVNGSQIEVAVTDPGTGVPVEHLERMFEPFFTTKPEPRSGLGLSFASSVMARLGGNIGASNRVGGGAVIMLVFPIAQDHQTIAQNHQNGHEARPRTVARDQSSRSVLVIDDDFENLDSMKAALELRGYEVSICSSGEEALELLHAGRNFDAIICDIGMPDMNGWEVAARISALKSRAKLFMLSGWANEIPESDPRRKLVVDVLAKPIDLELIDGILRCS
jgi:PAS domain S-box-containing protein